MKLFRGIDFETMGNCNRVCPTCIRNSHPDREKLKSWFTNTQLPMDLMENAMQQALEVNPDSWCWLSHYNEPLMDERLPQIAAMARSYPFSLVSLNTDGDLLTPELAADLDGKLDKIIITLYMKEPIKSQRAEWVKTLFHKTEAVVITMSTHMATHFSPAYDVKAMAAEYIDNTCGEPSIRVIINHRRNYLLCCDDVIGNFNLGTFPEISIRDYWYGPKHTKLHDALQQRGGRRGSSYCETCPRMG